MMVRPEVTSSDGTTKLYAKLPHNSDIRARFGVNSTKSEFALQSNIARQNGKFRMGTMTKIRWSFLAFAVVAGILVAVLSRKPASPPSLPVTSPPIASSKVTPQIEATYGASVMLAPDGTLWSWGSKQHSQILDSDSSVPRQIGTNADWVQVACGFTTFALALKADGSLWGWGATNAGQLGQPSKVSSGVLRRIHDGQDWSVVRAGASHAIGLKRDGSLWGWGQNDKGQLGDGSTRNRFVPVLISNDCDWKQIDTGHFNSFGLKSNGTLWGWGLAVPSQSGNDLLIPTQIDLGTNWSAVSAGDYHVLGLKTDGTLWLRGQNASVAAPQFATNSAAGFIQIGVHSDWCEIFSGANNFYARKSNGSWWVGGQNDRGQLSVGHRQRVPAPTPLPFGFEPWAFDVGGSSSAILLGDGSLWTTGERMGAPKKTIPMKRFRDALNSVTKAIGLGRVFDTWELTSCDEAPAKIWSFPESPR
jgi:regulator of chromosome condensation (RCC1) repeat-containing protein/Regulator of Chromosome Condensation (RCC1) repeat protein